jgi:hypothetical protein
MMIRSAWRWSRRAAYNASVPLALPGRRSILILRPPQSVSDLTTWPGVTCSASAARRRARADRSGLHLHCGGPATAAAKSAGLWRHPRRDPGVGLPTVRKSESWASMFNTHPPPTAGSDQRVDALAGGAYTRSARTRPGRVLGPHLPVPAGH